MINRPHWKRSKSYAHFAGQVAGYTYQSYAVGPMDILGSGDSANVPPGGASAADIATSPSYLLAVVAAIGLGWYLAK